MLNKCCFIGNLGADPELKYTQNQKPFCNLSVGVSETFKDSNGNKKTSTEWIRATVFGLQAENIAKYLAKGRQVYLEGKMETRKYTDKNGVEKYATSIIASNIVFLGGSQQQGQQQNQQQQNYAENPPYAAKPGEDLHKTNTPDPSTDEIPF